MVKKDIATPLSKVIKLSELGEVEFVTSGIAEVDAITGGFPRARVTEVYGKTGVGKTTLMTKTLVAMSEKETVLFIDSENAINKARIFELGGDLKKIDISSEYLLEAVADLVLANIGKYDVIIVDSIAGLVPKTESEGETGAANIGVKAKLIHQWMRKMIGRLGKSKTALVLINQLRESPDIYTPAFTTGGVAIPYAASLRLQLSNNKSDRIVKDKTFVGHWVNVEVTKSKVGRPYLTTKFRLDY